MLSLLFMFAIGFGVYVLAKRMNEPGPRLQRADRWARIDPRDVAEAEARKAAAVHAYGRRPGAPRFHASALKPAAPYLGLVFIPFLLTALIARDPIAASLMLAGCGAFAGLVLWHFNREERRSFNAAQDTESYFETSRAALDGFTIPEDWTRKYL